MRKGNSVASPEKVESAGGLNWNQLSLIHLAQKRLQMDDTDYRNMLQRVAGVSSAKDLAQTDMDAVMREFQRLGFVSAGLVENFGERDGMASTRQITMIRSLWRQYAGTESEKGLNTFLQKKCQVARLRFLTREGARKFICTLLRMAEYRKNKPRPSAKARAQQAMERSMNAIQGELDIPPF